MRYYSASHAGNAGSNPVGTTIIISRGYSVPEAPRQYAQYFYLLLSNKQL